MRVLMTKVHYKSSHDCNLGWCVMSLENILKKKKKKRGILYYNVVYKMFKTCHFLIDREKSLQADGYV